MLPHGNTGPCRVKWLDVLLSRAPQEPTDHLCHDDPGPAIRRQEDTRICGENRQKTNIKIQTKKCLKTKENITQATGN